MSNKWEQALRKMRSNLGVTLSTHGEFLGHSAWGGFWREKDLHKMGREKKENIYT